MEILNYSNDKTLQYLGGLQLRTVGKKYRFNKFCIKVEVEEGTLIYNGLSGAMVMIKPVELMNIETEDPCDYVDFLINHWFLVPIKYDEEAILSIIKERERTIITDTYLDHPEHFTILTTSACNARCFYCYELGLKNKTHMSLETAEKVAKYIIKHAPKDRSVTLDWFGGEPLFNHKMISIISSRVRSAGFDIQGTMISNGYLFDDNLIKVAKDDWNLQNVQITLDGTEEIYNKTKNYIYKNDENPFKRVINNIHKLADNKISVSIRMNCDKHNFEDLIKLVHYLHEEFKGNDLVSMYVWPIFEEGFKRSEEERTNLFKSIQKVEDIMFEYGYNLGHNIPFEINSIHCMADRGNAICIYPKGEIGVCEHYLDSKFVSHIDNPNEKNWEVLKEWRNYTPYTEICKDCPLKPLCLRLKGCTDAEPCCEQQKIYMIDHYKKSMIEEWNKYKNNKDKSCKDSCCAKPDCYQHQANCMEHQAPNDGNVWVRQMSDGTIIPIKTYQK